VLATAVVAVLLGAAFAAYRSGAFGAGDGVGSGDYRAQLEAKVVNILEDLPAEGHGHHANAADAGDAKLVCAVNILGTNPADADAVGEVAQVYGYHMCALPQKDMPWLYAPKLTGPLVVTLAADPPTVTVVEGGENFEQRVRAAIPAPYQEDALRAALTEKNLDDLKQRYEDAAG
jgi:hypothetical protein